MTAKTEMETIWNKIEDFDHRLVKAEKELIRRHERHQALVDVIQTSNEHTDEQFKALRRDIQSFRATARWLLITVGGTVIIALVRWVMAGGLAFPS